MNKNCIKISLKKQLQLRGLLLVGLLGAWLNGNAQNNYDYSINLGCKTGKIFRHSDLFGPDITERSSLYELSFNWHTKGNKVYQQLYAYPVVGLNVIHAQFGDATVFGEAYGIMPSLTFIKRYNKVQLQYRVGAGLAYLSKPFNLINNIANNVIGSHVNNMTMFSFAVAWQWHKQWQLLANLSFTHFSNARVRFPNLGINVPAYGVGLRFFPIKPSSKQNYSVLPLPSYSKKMNVVVRLSHGFTTSGPPGGPVYGVYGFDAYVTVYKRFTWQLMAGLTGDFYTNIYHYAINNVTVLEKNYKEAIKIAPFFGAECFFGRVSATVMLGAYVYDPFLQRGAVLTKLGLQCYVWPMYSKRSNQIAVGLWLKSHAAKADYTALTVSYMF